MTEANATEPPLQQKTHECIWNGVVDLRISSGAVVVSPQKAIPTGAVHHAFVSCGGRMTDLLLAGFFIAVAAFCQLWLWADRKR